jgi:hypothetical protein
LILNGTFDCCLVPLLSTVAVSTDYYFCNICLLPFNCYTTRASIYPCFCARPVAVNLAIATGEIFKLENEKVKIRTKGGCCFVHYSFTWLATKGQSCKRAKGFGATFTPGFKIEEARGLEESKASKANVK